MTWKLDMAHSAIEFSVRHMMVSTVKGNFREFSADLELDPEDLTKSSVRAVVKVASIDTREPQRNAHLTSADFFEAEKFPEMVFQSTRVEHLGGDRYRVTGDLTIKDVTRPITLDVTHLGTQVSPYGVKAAGFEATATLSRKDFGLTWNVALETGGMLVGDEVKISVDAEANLVDEAAVA
ncbi:MAG: YceI family protein [Candidatus Dormibacteria bacterium]